MNLFELAAKLTLDSSQYEKGIKAASDSANSIGGKIGGALKTAGKIGVTAFTAITSAAIGMSTALVKSVSDVAAYGDNIDKMSQKMGLSAQAYQEWDAIMQHSGTSMESLKAGMKTLANAVESGNDAFDRLGISQDQIASMNQEDLFAATISALQNVEDETERTYLAGQLLGRGATELGPLLNMTAEETDEMRKRVHELGGVMSDDAVKAAAQFDDNLQDLKTSLSGIKMSLTTGFLPGINDVVAGFTSLIIGEEGAEEQLKTGFDSILTNIDNVIPRIVDVISGLADAVVVAAPHIVKAGIALIKGLGKALLDNADVVIDAAFEIIQIVVDEFANPEGLIGLIDAAFTIIEKLAAGLTENLPVLIPAIVDIILNIAEKLVDPANITMIMGAATDIMLALIDGIMNSLPDLIARAPELIMDFAMAIINMKVQLFLAGVQILGELILGIASVFENLTQNGREIVQKVWDGVKQRIEEAKTWGKDLIQNFISGITAKWQALKEKVSGIASGIKSLIGFSEPEEGPLSDFHTYAPDMMDLFAKGVTDNAGMLHNKIAKAFDFSDAATMPEMTYSVTGTDSRMAQNNDSVILNAILARLNSIEAYLPKLGTIELDGEVVANSVDQRLGRIAAQKARV